MAKLKTHTDESGDYKTAQGKLGIQVKNLMVRGKIEPVALVITILVAILFFSVINPRFSSIENLRNILVQVSIPIILGVGATLIILLGSIDLSIQGVMASSAMVFVLLSSNSRGSHDYGIWAVIAGIITGAIFGWINGIILTKLRVPSFVATLGMWYVGLGIATVLFGTTAIPFLSEKSISGWNTRLSHGVPNSFWAAASAVLLGTLLLAFTSIGRHTLAIGNNEIIARNSGLKVDKTKIAIFTIAGAFTGIAGIMGAIQLGSGSLDVGNGTLFVTIPAVVIGGTALSGGKGGILRTVLGTFLLIILNNGLILSGVSSNYQSGVAGAILILAIVLSKLSHRDSTGVKNES